MLNPARWLEADLFHLFRHAFLGRARCFHSFACPFPRNFAAFDLLFLGHELSASLTDVLGLLRGRFLA